MGKMSRKEVLERFEEAVYTAKRLPPVIIPGCKAAWPDIIYTPLEILQQEKRPIKLRPSSEQLSRLDEVLSWTPILTELERKLIWYKAQRKPWKFICTALGISKSSGNEKLNKALDYLSDRIASYFLLSYLSIMIDIGNLCLLREYLQILLPVVANACIAFPCLLSIINCVISNPIFFSSLVSKIKSGLSVSSILIILCFSCHDFPMDVCKKQSKYSFSSILWFFILKSIFSYKLPKMSLVLFLLLHNNIKVHKIL